MVGLNRGGAMFKHELGALAESITLGVRGIIVARSQNLYGCDRYFIQPKAGKDMKVPDGFWMDADDVVVKGKGVTVKKKPTGGPISKIH